MALILYLLGWYDFQLTDRLSFHEIVVYNSPLLIYMKMAKSDLSLTIKHSAMVLFLATSGLPYKMLPNMLPSLGSSNLKNSRKL